MRQFVNFHEFKQSLSIPALSMLAQQNRMRGLSSRGLLDGMHGSVQDARQRSG